MSPHIKLMAVVCALFISIIALGMVSGCERRDIYNTPKVSLESLIAIDIGVASHQTGTVEFDGPILSGATYQNCERLTLVLRASTAFLIADEDITADLDCGGLCGFYSNSTCSTSITQATIPAGSSSSPDFFVRPTAASLSLSTPGVAPYYTGSSITGIPVNAATYNDIDAQYVWSVSNLYSLGTYIDQNNIQPGDVWVFESRDGYRGKIVINSVSMVNVNGDTLNFDVVLWDSSYIEQNNVTSSTITACFSGNCYMDLDQPTVVVNYTSNVDVWWENLSGNLYFNPQASAVFRLLP